MQVARFACAFATAAALAGIAHADPAITPPLPTIELLRVGKAIYGTTCAACHGVRGDGNGPVAFSVKPPPRNLIQDPFKNGDRVDQVFATITSGLAKTSMVGYPHLAVPERWGVAYYVVAFRAKRAR